MSDLVNSLTPVAHGAWWSNLGSGRPWLSEGNIQRFSNYADLVACTNSRDCDQRSYSERGHKIIDEYNFIHVKNACNYMTNITINF